MKEPILTVQTLQIMAELLKPIASVCLLVVVLALGLNVMRTITKMHKGKTPLYDDNDNETIFIKGAGLYATDRKQRAFINSFRNMNELGEEELYSFGGDLL